MIKVLFFASLREQTGQSDLNIEWQEDMTAQTIWQQTTNSSTMPDNVLVACNQAYCDRETLINDGDEVAFFPPVTGG